MDVSAKTIWVFILVTMLIGGSAAWMTGRAVATTWRPFLHILFYGVALAGGVRFLHYALFGESFLSIERYILDVAVMFSLASLGFRRTRARQMTIQYRWLYEPSSPLSWKLRSS